ncbi:MAG: carbamoyltransferase HypF [Chloroflexota bacterium]
MAKHISVKGIVQGVGFRPFVYGLATRLELRGWVCNTSGGVEIHLVGDVPKIEQFVHSLTTETPPLAKIDSMVVQNEESDGRYATFDILPSIDIENVYQPISADVAICPDCERELFNPADRRYLYPFINCTNCGPRFTIIKEIPYDRPGTTMGEFEMCEQCSAEYKDPLNRRFHAQPIACPNCGPFVALRQDHSQFPGTSPRISSIEYRNAAILKARRLLREGYIIAIKGLGGFHLACDASNSFTVEELRDRKGRVDKPFAAMAANIATVKFVCDLGIEEHALLTSREKPIVLLRKKDQTEQSHLVSKWVAPNVDTLGVMLPYTPLHHLLLNQTDPAFKDEPVPPLLVMTSGNYREEPIAINDEDALQRLSPLADAFLLHNRAIHMRCDDSVVRVDHGQLTMDNEVSDTVRRPSSTVYLRRSRGYAPYPVKLSSEARPTLAVGGELKNTFCLARDQYAFLSQHIGDLENAETYQSFEEGIQHLSTIFRVQPEIIAHDLHPNYFTTQYAKRSDVEQVGVQHHHAHIASCMVDNGLDDRQLIGLSFDGTGYGTDGAIWGGEVLLASFAAFERFAHLEYLPLPGSDSAIRSPWRIAAGYAHALGIDIDDLPFLHNTDSQSLNIVRQQIDRKLNSPLTSSMGRLFDAVASLIGVRNEVTYEAQAAIEMEVLAKPFISLVRSYPYIIEETGQPESNVKLVVRLKELLSSIVEDVRANESAGMIGARFHKTIAGIAVELCKRARQSTGLNEVALSGGVWQNQILLDLVRDGLRQAEFIVYVHQQVPANDGGIALGQAVIANHVVAKQRFSAEVISE